MLCTEILELTERPRRGHRDLREGEHCPESDAGAGRHCYARTSRISVLRCPHCTRSATAVITVSPSLLQASRLKRRSRLTPACTRGSSAASRIRGSRRSGQSARQPANMSTCRISRLSDRRTRCGTSFSPVHGASPRTVSTLARCAQHHAIDAMHTPLRTEADPPSAAIRPADHAARLAGQPIWCPSKQRSVCCAVPPAAPVLSMTVSRAFESSAGCPALQWHDRPPDSGSAARQPSRRHERPLAAPRGGGRPAAGGSKLAGRAGRHVAAAVGLPHQQHQQCGDG